MQGMEISKWQKQSPKDSAEFIPTIQTLPPKALLQSNYLLDIFIHYFLK